MDIDKAYLESVNKQKKYKYLYHFTSFDNLKKIIANQALRLSRITELNDPIEAKRVASIWRDKCFILSFTNTLENCDYFGENTLRITVSVWYFVMRISILIYVFIRMKNWKTRCHLFKEVV